MKDDRKFVDVVESIVKSESDVDKILKAAKLERHEQVQTKLNAEQKMSLLDDFIFMLPLIVVTLGAIAFILITKICA